MIKEKKTIDYDRMINVFYDKDIKSKYDYEMICINHESKQKPQYIIDKTINIEKN